MWDTHLSAFAPYKWIFTALIVLVVLGGTNTWSYFHGKKIERATWLEQQAEAMQQKEQEREKLAEMGRLAERQFSAKERTIWRLKDELDRKIAGATDGRVCFANWDAVRLWNQALSGTSSVPGDTGKPAERSTGAGVTDADVLRNHNDNAARWAQCREQVKAIRELYNKQRGR